MITFKTETILEKLKYEEIKSIICFLVGAGQKRRRRPSGPNDFEAFFSFQTMTQIISKEIYI